MNYIVTEKQLKFLTENVGLLNEQKSGFQVPQKAQDAVVAIEKKFGTYGPAGIGTLNYTGDEKLGWMRDYVRDTIGFDCWNNMSDKMKAQIYSQVFQADGGDKPKQFLVIAALASCIDPKIQRTSVSRKNIDDPAVKNAIQVIKNKCANINDYYDCLVSTIISQYQGTVVPDYNAEKVKYLWVPRPTAIDKIMNGTSTDIALKEWEESLKKDEDKKSNSSTGTLQDYEGNYTFVSENGEKTIGNIKEENGKLLVSKGSNSFYLTKIKTDQFEGKTKASNKEDERIPKMLGYITIDITAKFNRNSNNQVCGVDGIANWKGKKEKMIATKDGVSCTSTPEQKSITTTSVPSQKPVTPATPQQPEQKPVTPTTPQTTKTLNRKKPLIPLDVVSPNKYVAKESVKSNKVISEDIKNTKQSNQKIGLDAIFVGGIDDKKGYYPLEKQLAIFKQGFSGNNVKAFGYKTPYETILKYLTLYPKIPIFLFSAGCNLADEIMNSKFVDKKKVYLIEPWNRSLNQLNQSVTNAISKGLPPKNIFVRTDEPGRGYGISGASDSESGPGIKGHWNSLITVPQKLNY